LADITGSDPQQQGFLDLLSHIGFIVRTKPRKVTQDDSTGERVVKCNLDPEMITDMLSTEPNYDVAFLLSGDSDFTTPVDTLRSKGKRVYIVTSRRACSRELAYVADKPILFLDELGPYLSR
jgi:uncharacterized LabA/DUF88 family protein